MSSEGKTFFFSLFLTLVNLTYCLECYTCLSGTDQLLCTNQTTRCGQNEVCFTDWQGASFTSGCVNIQQCSTGSQAGVLVGRDVSTRQSADCYECCSTDLCNKYLCVHTKPSACVDDETVDCPKMHTLFGICSDVQKAKLVCAKFCNLCSLVDGQWSDWSSWSICSVTCGNGTETRRRTCTNPAPANGGLDCQGSATEAKPCILEPCPVHGGWSLWSEWGSCSVSCDVGMQRRDRSCTNPYPDRNGNHCFGDSRDDRICMPRACSDGSWSNWESWSACSDSCGGGVKTRERSCSNPTPSLVGKPCIGTSVQSSTCSKNPCPGHKVAFAASGPISKNRGGNLIFQTVGLNLGNRYHNDSGLFLCSVPGLYYFSVSLSGLYGVQDVRVLQCTLKVNSVAEFGSFEKMATSNSDFGLSITITGTFYLQSNDYVSVGDCIGESVLDNGIFSSFAGFLIIPDN